MAKQKQNEKNKTSISKMYRFITRNGAVGQREVEGLVHDWHGGRAVGPARRASELPRDDPVDLEVYRERGSRLQRISKRSDERTRDVLPPLERAVVATVCVTGRACPWKR
jgi:hypothetical protein